MAFEATRPTRRRSVGVCGEFGVAEVSIFGYFEQCKQTKDAHPDKRQDVGNKRIQKCMINKTVGRQ